MKKLFTLILFTAVAITVSAQTGTWRAYMAYSTPQQIVKGDHYLYVRASNNLYTYNLSDHSIDTYDKIRQLSDTDIDRIAWNAVAKRLLILYQNKNIDLLSEDGSIFNISSYMNRTMTQDKTVNSVFIYQHYAYLCTAFGMVKLNIRKGEVSESYILNRNIVSAASRNDSLFIRDSEGGVLVARASANLIDPSSWSTTTSVTDDFFKESTADWDEYIELVNSLQPGGPKYNYFNYMKYENNMLQSVGGGWRTGNEFARPAVAQMMDNNGQWTIVDEAQPYSSWRFTDATAIAFDPNDPSHFFLSTCGSGLYEYRNNQMVKNYTADNSPLLSALDPEKYPDAYKIYVRVDGLVFDNDGYLWMTCSAEADNKDNVLRLNPATGEWKTYNDDLLKYNKTILYILRRSILDKNGNIWMVNDHHNHPCMIRITPQTETFARYDNFTNQDGTKTELHYIRAVAQDLDGNIWMGSDQGLYMYTPEQQENTTLGYTQVKVPRNDGSNLADYLLSTVDVTAIAIDGANRKWIGTGTGGVYLISADNMTQLHHFTTEDSELLSDVIETIAINPTTGEVFIGTDKGLCSYMSDATAAVDEMKKDDVYAFPNPVPSGYNGLITVRGLSMDADVKILTISGKLVAQGRSNGGTFTWNGRDQSGRRVASGVYMIATATSSGKSGVVAKVAVVR